MEVELNFQLFAWRNNFWLIIGITLDSPLRGTITHASQVARGLWSTIQQENWEQGCFMISTECAKMQQYIILGVVEKFCLAFHVHNGQFENTLFINTNNLFIYNAQWNI